MFYPGAILVMPTRVFAVLILTIHAAFWDTVISIGHDYEKGPMEGWRKKLSNLNHKWACAGWLWFAQMKVTESKTDFDYSEYLGPDYKKGYKKNINASTMIANHVSWCDGLVVRQYKPYSPALEANLKSNPVIGPCADAMNCLYIPRGGKAEAKKLVIEAI